MNRLVFCLLLTTLSFTTTSFAAKGTLQQLDPRQAPGFELADLDGRTQQLEDYQGKYLLVNFWAVWCAPCRAEMPSMQRVHDQYAGDKFEMLAIHVGPSVEGARQFADSLKLTFPILVDEQMELSDWKVIGLPTTYLIDPQGKIIAQAVGDRAWDSQKMRKALEQYLGS